MKNTKLLIAMAVLLITSITFAVSYSNPELQEKKEGEENGKQLTKEQTYKDVRKGVLMELSFDKKTSSFIGVVENVTKKVIKRVRVEIHLSNGIELGPTKSVDLKPGQKSKVKLSAKGQEFKMWNTHAESGSSEGGHGSKERGAHGREGKEGSGHNESSEKGEHGSERG